jgi:hypothetical protein
VAALGEEEQEKASSRSGSGYGGEAGGSGRRRPDGSLAKSVLRELLFGDGDSTAR